MYKVSVIKKNFVVQAGAKNIVSAAADAVAVIKDANGNTLKTEQIPSGQTENITITNGNINRSDATLITTILAQGTATINDSVVTLKNTATTTLSTTNVKADSTADIVAPDATGTAKNSLGTTIGTGSAPSGGNGNINVADSLIKRSDNSTIASNPAAADYTVADSPVRVEYVNGTLISNINVLAASSATIQVPNPATLQDNVDASTPTEIVTAVTNANKDGLVLEGLAVEYGGIASFNTWGSTTTPYCVNVNNNEFYVVLDGGSVQVFDAATRTLQRTVLGFGTQCRHIRFNATQYLVNSFGSAQVRVMTTATDVQAALITPTTQVFSAEFNPNNGNVFWASGSVITEVTQANATVGATFSTANVTRQRTLKNEPSTNRIWLGGDSGTATVGRLSYFDATTRAFTSIVFSGTITFAINVITGMAFGGGFIYVIHQTGGSAAMCLTKINDTGVVQGQTLILGDDSGICGTYYTGYGCPVVLYAISILNTNGIAKAL
jgi:hypothetical protein